MSNKVLFRFEEDPDKEVVVEVGEGDSILDAALDNDLHLNHNCGAVCACSTCHVYIDKGMKTQKSTLDWLANVL